MIFRNRSFAIVSQTCFFMICNMQYFKLLCCFECQIPVLKVVGLNPTLVTKGFPSVGSPFFYGVTRKLFFFIYVL